MVVKVDDVTCKGRTYKGVFFNVSWASKTILAPLCYVTVVSEGSASDIFDLMTTRSLSSPDGSKGSGADAHDVTVDDEDGEEIDATIIHPLGSRAEDIQMVRSQGLEVDDDNEPPQKIFQPLARSHSQQTSTLGSHGDGMGSIRERLSSRQKRMHHLIMIGHPLENHILTFFSSYFPSHGFLVVAWRQHQTETLTMMANPSSMEKFGGILACGF